MATLQGCIRPSLRSVAFRDRAALIVYFNDLIVQAITSLVVETDEGFPAIGLRNRLKADPEHTLSRCGRTPPGETESAGTRTQCRGIAWRKRPHPKDHARSVAPITRLQHDITAQVRRYPEKLPFSYELYTYFTRSRRSGQDLKRYENALCPHTSAWNTRAVEWPQRKRCGGHNGGPLWLWLRLLLRFLGPTCRSRAITSSFR
jgi:hypothetical protein